MTGHFPPLPEPFVKEGYYIRHDLPDLYSKNDMHAYAETAIKQMTRAPSDRGQGRKPLPPDQKTRPYSVRLTDARIAKLQLLKSDWLNKAIDRENVPTPIGDKRCPTPPT